MSKTGRTNQSGSIGSQLITELLRDPNLTELLRQQLSTTNTDSNSPQGSSTAPEETAQVTPNTQRPKRKARNDPSKQNPSKSSRVQASEQCSDSSEESETPETEESSDSEDADSSSSDEDNEGLRGIIHSPSSTKVTEPDTSRGSAGSFAVMTSLLAASLSANTRTTYDRFLNRFSMFIASLPNSPCILPASSHIIARFITHLHIQGFAPSTIASHLSAISLIHKLQDFRDPTRDFLPQRVLLGCKKIRNIPDQRRPILHSDLLRLLGACQKITSQYNSVMYKCIFSIAHHGFFRIGELLPKNKLTKSTLEISNVHLSKTTVSFQLNHYKTRTSAKPLVVRLDKTKSPSCPVRNVRKYLKIRGSQKGPFFVCCDNTPVTQSMFNTFLRKALVFVGLSPKIYKGHSFRIGACTQAAMSGIPHAKIQSLGRWKSGAFKRYIRL